jgi:hypothetical protein
MKRQFHDAAAALRREAELGEQTVVPIDCQQGLLFEWWAVFWDVFSTGNGKPQPSLEAVQFMNVSIAKRLVDPLLTRLFRRNSVKGSLNISRWDWEDRHSQ